VCEVLGCVGEKGLGEFFHRESHRRELTERACQRRVGCLDVLVVTVCVTILEKNKGEESFL